MDSLQSIKQRFGIIGNNLGLNRALEKAMRVSGTDISVLVIGESGVGKENIPKIIHQYSHRKHSKYIAVNWLLIGSLVLLYQYTPFKIEWVGLVVIGLYVVIYALLFKHRKKLRDSFALADNS